MLKTTRSPDKPASSRNNSSKSASNRNNDSKQVSGKNDGNGEVYRFGISGNGIEHAKKSGKWKSEKMSKSQNLAKSGKKLPKSGNLTNSDITEDGPKFLIPDAKTAFNRLWLAFTEAPIL